MIDAILAGLARSTLALAVAACCALLLLAVLRPRSPRAHQVVWFTVLLQAFCWKPFGLAVLPPAVAPEGSAVVESTPLDLSNEDASAPAPLATSSEVAATPVSLTPAATVALPTAVSPAPLWSWKPFAVGGWAAGVIALLAVGVVDYVRLLRRLRREASAPPPEWAAAWQALPHGRSALIATETLGPLAIRAPSRSIVALPRTFGDSLPPAERRAVLAHELNHLRSGDPVWALFAWLATTLQWFNPFAWLATRRFRAATELACDARLDEESRLPLARVLLHLGQQKPRAALAAAGGTLGARIRALAQPRPAAEPSWRSVLLATLVAAAALGGWVRLEARPAQQEESVKRGVEPPAGRMGKDRRSSPTDLAQGQQKQTARPTEDGPLQRAVGKKRPPASDEKRDASGEPLPQAIRKADERLKQLEAEMKQARAAVVEVDSERTKAVNGLKPLEAAKNTPPEALAKVAELNKRLEEAQSAFQKKSAEYAQLKRKAEGWRRELADQQKKLEHLWIRNVRQSSPEDDDALALEKTLHYLAAREPKFGAAELLPYEEHVETEAVRKLEGLLKRNYKPRPGETQRQALERVLQAPLTEARKRFTQLREGLKKAAVAIPLWEDRRDQWLGLVASFCHPGYVASPLWPLRAGSHESAPAGWIDACCYLAAVRMPPFNEAKANAGFFLETFNRSGEPSLLRTILLAETACKANAPHCSETWAKLREQVAAPQKSQYGDLRTAPFVADRLVALLTAAKESTVYAKNCRGGRSTGLWSTRGGTALRE